MDAAATRFSLKIALAASIGLPLLSGCGGGATETGTAPVQHEATVGGHDAVGGAAGPNPPGAQQSPR